MILFFLSVLLLAGAKLWLRPQAAAGEAPSQEQKARLGESGGGQRPGDSASPVQQGVLESSPGQAKPLV